MGSRKYSTPVDVWSIGCIFAEMVNGRPLVTGTSEGDQLDRIFRLFGTPSPANYPTITDLPDYSPDIPQHPMPDNLSGLVPQLDAVGLELFESMMQFDPGRRTTAADALQHSFFDDMRAA